MDLDLAGDRCAGLNLGRASRRRMRELCGHGVGAPKKSTCATTEHDRRQAGLPDRRLESVAVPCLYGHLYRTLVGGDFRSEFKERGWTYLPPFVLSEGTLRQEETWVSARNGDVRWPPICPEAYRWSGSHPKFLVGPAIIPGRPAQKSGARAGAVDRSPGAPLQLRWPTRGHR